MKKKYAVCIVATFMALVVSTSVLLTIIICNNRHSKEMANLENRIRFEYEEKTFVIPEKLIQGETYQRLWGDNQ